MATRQREKAIKRQENKDKRPYAIAKNIRITPSKAGEVLDLIRGKSVEKAATILTLKTNSAAPVVLKVLNSAAANAENNMSLAKDELFVAECFAGAASTLKRLSPRARGRGNLILKRSCHITVILDRVGGGV